MVGVSEILVQGTTMGSSKTKSKKSAENWQKFCEIQGQWTKVYYSATERKSKNLLYNIFSLKMFFCAVYL